MCTNVIETAAADVTLLICIFYTYTNTLRVCAIFRDNFWYRHVQRNKNLFSFQFISKKHIFINISKERAVLTGHVKSKWNCIGLIEIFVGSLLLLPMPLFCCCCNKSTLLSPNTFVLTSPNVHGELLSILAW